MRWREFITGRRHLIAGLGSAAAWPLAARALKSFIFWIIMAGVITFLAVMYLYDNLGLEVKVNSINNSVSIKNIGSKPTKILDLDINNSDDCTIFKSWAGTQFSPAYGEDKQDLHKFFVYQGFHQFKGLTGLLTQFEEIVHTQTPIVLGIGDTDIWVATCSTNIMRVTVTTERGSATFSFTPPY
jgi:hypothetical protein